MNTHKSRIYAIAKNAKGTEFVLGRKAALMLKTIGPSGAMYDEISRRTGIPTNSLMVFAQRLEAAKLVHRTKLAIDGRQRTIVVKAPGLTVNASPKRI